jgi:hypothetical protein
VNPIAVEMHKKTILYAMTRNLYTHEIEIILNERKRSVTTEEFISFDFFSGDIPHHQIIKDTHYYDALSHAYKSFSPPELCRPVHILDVEHHYPHKTDSNAEAPFSTEPFFIRQLRDPIYRERHNLIGTDPRPSFGSMKNIIFDWSRRIHHLIKDNAPFEQYLYYILLHSKTALIDFEDPNKLRSISGFPRPQNIAYIMFLWSYMAHLKRNVGRTPLLWGYETITGGWFKLNAELFNSHIRGSIVTLDKSRFDKYYSFEIQDDIDMMIRSFLNFGEGYIPTQEYPNTDDTWSTHKAQRLQNLWKWLCYSFRQAPTVLFNGQKYRRRWFGMPSGVYTTQLYDTIHFFITNHSVLFSMGITLNQIVLHKGEGDDIIFKLSLLIQPNEHEQFLHTYAETDRTKFGSEIRPEKCEVKNSPQDVHVLGYRNNHGLPYRDPIELLAQLYHTKMATPTPEKTMATCIGIAYALMQFDKPTSIRNRAYEVCKDGYNYYRDQGYSPDARTFALTFYHDVTIESEIDITEFPSQHKIQQSLMNYSYEPPPSMKRFWPSWFKSEF